MAIIDTINHGFSFVFSSYPSHLILYVTSRCNARCKHCFYWKEIDIKKKQELSLNEIKKLSGKRYRGILNNAGSWLCCHD